MLDKLKEEDKSDKENIKEEENKLTMQYKPFSVSDELKDLEAEVEASMRAGNTLKNAGDVFKDTVLNCELNGALGKEMKKDEKRKKRETKKEEKRQKKLDREEEQIVKKYTKRIEKIMERYNKADKVQRKRDEKRRKQVETHERKAQKMLEKEMMKKKEGLADGKKQEALTTVEKGKHNDIKKNKTMKETENTNGQEKKKKQAIDGTKKNKTKNGEEKNIDEMEKESQSVDDKKGNIDMINTINSEKKNKVTSSILSFFRMFSCKKRQGKAVV